MSNRLSIKIPINQNRKKKSTWPKNKTIVYFTDVHEQVLQVKLRILWCKIINSRVDISHFKISLIGKNMYLIYSSVFVHYEHDLLSIRPSLKLRHIILIFID